MLSFQFPSGRSSSRGPDALGGGGGRGFIVKIPITKLPESQHLKPKAKVEPFMQQDIQASSKSTTGASAAAIAKRRATTEDPGREVGGSDYLYPFMFVSLSLNDLHQLLNVQFLAENHGL